MCVWFFCCEISPIIYESGHLSSYLPDFLSKEAGGLPPPPKERSDLLFSYRHPLRGDVWPLAREHAIRSRNPFRPASEKDSSAAIATPNDPQP